MIRFFYNLLWPIGLLFFLPGYIAKMIRRGGYRKNFGQRLGWYDVDLRRRLAERRSTWLHAVSVGEVGVAIKLAKRLRALEPDVQCVLTTTTTTGFAFALNNAPDWIEVMYSPLDFWPIMRRAFRVIQPERVLLTEAEIWPNLAAIAHKRQVPLALINARLSKKSERRFHLFRFAVSPVFRLLDLVCVQEPEDVDRWVALGIEPARIHHVGSIKYDPADGDVDLAAPRDILGRLKLENRPIVLGGSTHPGEEEALGRIAKELRERFAEMFLIVAPRHAERAGEVCHILQRLGLTVVRRSALPPEGKIDALVLDTTGELQNWYSVADVVFVGKSLTVHGGQNPVEPILAGKAVVFGPHMENFQALAQTLVTKHGARQVSSEEELKNAVVDLLLGSRAREQLVENARKVLEVHRGATERTAKLVFGLESR